MGANNQEHITIINDPNLADNSANIKKYLTAIADTTEQALKNQNSQHEDAERKHLAALYAVAILQENIKAELNTIVNNAAYFATMLDNEYQLWLKTENPIIRQVNNQIGENLSTSLQCHKINFNGLISRSFANDFNCKTMNDVFPVLMELNKTTASYIEDSAGANFLIDNKSTVHEYEALQTKMQTYSSLIQEHKTVAAAIGIIAGVIIGITILAAFTVSLLLMAPIIVPASLWLAAFIAPAVGIGLFIGFDATAEKTSPSLINAGKAIQAQEVNAAKSTFAETQGLFSKFAAQSNTSSGDTLSETETHTDVERPIL